MSDLCCCEYIDIEGERSHLLASLCNCQDIDEGFEGLITGNGIPAHNKKQALITIQDRMRVPWLGGAKQVNPNIAIPIILLPTFLLIATISLHFTIISFTSLFIFLILIYKYAIEAMPRFFLMWTIVSLVILYVIYQVIVISFLLILLEENIGVSVAILIAIVCIYKTKLSVIRMREREIINDKSSDRTQYCPLCQIYTPDGTQHHYWIDSCITTNNRSFYIIGLLSTLTALLYSSNLTLTSVCHPFRFFLTVLLPDDCSDVYGQIELSLSFVTAVYSILVSFYIAWKLLETVCICCLGPRRMKSLSRGFLCNRFRIFCCYINQYRMANVQHE